MIKYTYIVKCRDVEIQCGTIKDVIKTVNNIIGVDILTKSTVWNKIKKNTKKDHSHNFYEIVPIRQPPIGPYVKKSKKFKIYLFSINDLNKYI